MKFLTLSTFILVNWLNCSEDETVAGDDQSNTIPIVAVEPAFPALTFALPVDLQAPPDTSNRLFVVEQEGTIRVFPNQPDIDSSQLFLDLTDRVNKEGWEEGLLGLAFHPNFSTNGYFFVNYTAKNPRRTVISRFQASPPTNNSANKASELIILTFNQPYANHNGGCLQFGPDGYLYIGTGDGGAAGDPHGNGQNLGVLLGKMLRIDIDNTTDSLNYSIPGDNPYRGNPNQRPEIWAYGLRNPWRYSFDRDGRLWAGDVGQNRYEEIDIINRGENYGWRTMEGNHCYNPITGCKTEGLTLPVIEYPQPTGASVTGGRVYYGELVPAMKNMYIYADFMTGKIWAASLPLGNSRQLTANDLTVTELIDTELGISSFGVDRNDELYLCAFDGQLYRFKSLGVRKR